MTPRNSQAPKNQNNRLVSGAYHTEGHHGHNNKNSVLDILQERYAKGEIDKKEFEEKKKDLTD